MSHKIKFFFFLSFILSVGLSCKKQCENPSEDVISGDIIKDAYVLGFNTGGVKSVHHEESLANPIKVSFDKGYTYVPVDYTKYAVMNFPVSAGCNTHFERDVQVNVALSKVTYTLKMQTCKDCEDRYIQDNWVLVPAFSPNYQVIFIKE